MGTVETVEKNKVRLTFEVAPERFQEGLKFSYNKNKNYVNIPGFRKGKAPRKVIERMYGKDFFYDDAINHVLPSAYESALEENNIDPVYRPDIKLNEANEDSGVTFEAEVYVKPEVEIDGYYGLTYPKADTEPTDADIQAKLEAEQQKNARTISVERPAENGDILNISFTGYVDGEPFEGGSSEDYELNLGSHTFIDTFEDQLVGCSAGDDVEVNVTFPENYGHAHLADKPALFKVEILDVKTRELPEINDEFAQDVSEFDSLAEYREHLSGRIREEKGNKAETDKNNHVLKQLLEKAVMDVPEVMYKAYAEDMMEDMRFRLKQQGLSLEMYMQFAQTTEQELMKNYEAQGHEMVNASLVLEALAKKEALEISDEEYGEYIAKQAEQSNTTVEKLNEMISDGRKKEIINDLLKQKAMDFVLDKAVEY